MHLNIVLSNEKGYLPEELQQLIAFFRQTFDEIVPPKKQSVLVRVYSNFFFNKYGRKIFYFSVGNDEIKCEFEMTGASTKMDISDLEEMATMLFLEDSFEFELRCKGSSTLETKLSFEKCGAGSNIIHAFIESEDEFIASHLSKTFSGYALDQKHLTITNDRGSFLYISKLVREESEAQFKTA